MKITKEAFSKIVVEEYKKLIKEQGSGGFQKVPLPGQSDKEPIVIEDPGDGEKVDESAEELNEQYTAEPCGVLVSGIQELIEMAEDTGGASVPVSIGQLKDILARHASSQRELEEGSWPKFDGMKAPPSGANPTVRGTLPEGKFKLPKSRIKEIIKEEVDRFVQMQNEECLGENCGELEESVDVFTQVSEVVKGIDYAVQNMQRLKQSIGGEIEGQALEHFANTLTQKIKPYVLKIQRLGENEELEEGSEELEEELDNKKDENEG